MITKINYIQILSTELPRVSAEGKYLLAKLLYDRSWEKLPAHSMRYLAEFGDMGLEATHRALCELEDNGLIELKNRETLSGKKTFRTLSLILNAGLMTYLDEEPAPLAPRRRKPTTRIPVPVNQHQALIGKLMDSGFPWRSGTASISPTGKIQIISAQGAKSIPVRQRLTLWVLLTYANNEGVVRNLSKSDLIRLTGIGSEQMTYQINRLIENGYIRTAVPGISGPGFLKRAKGAYFINLDYPDFELPRGGRLTITATLPGTEWRLASQALIDTIQYASKEVATSQVDGEFVMHSVYRKEDELSWLGKLADKETLLAMHAVVPWEQVQKTKTLKQYIQLKIDEYATLFLNEHFNAIGIIERLQTSCSYYANDEFSIRSKLSDIIMEDLFKYELRKYNKESRPKKQSKQFILISHQFLYASVQLANIVKSVFIRATGSENAKARFLIVTNNIDKDDEMDKTIQIECFNSSFYTRQKITISIENECQEISKSKYRDIF